jgi:D-alanine-D-alanine ligase
MGELDYVVVLAGGLSPEREISLRSGEQVRDALSETGVQAVLADADASLLDRLRSDPPTAVFPVIHGAPGEDGSVREVLGLFGVPYVGSLPSACRMAFDKPTAKVLVAAAGLSTPESVTLPRETFHDLGAAAVIDLIVGQLGMPLFVKPSRGGSALGASAARSTAELATAIVGCFGYGDAALIEPLVSGTEVAVGVIDLGDGPQALPPVEIVAPGGVYDYAARYTPGQTEFYTPARLAGVTAQEAARVAVAAHAVLGLRDISRTDLIVDTAGAVHFLEVNVAPGMTSTSTLPMAMRAAGIDLGACCATLLERAAERAALPRH